MTDKKTLLIINLIAYVVMVIINVFSQFGVLNGVNTAEISARYTTLFTPSGITFSIWMLIYVMLGIYTFKQMFGNNTKYNRTVALLYLITIILNVLWIFAWHYMNPLISMIIIIFLMAGLWMIVLRSGESDFFTRATFSIYLAWITVAAIASVFVFLSSVMPFDYDESIYIILVYISFICIAVLVVLMGRNRKDLPYVLAITWGVVGILNKHISINGFNKEYMSVIIGCVLLICFCLYQVIMIKCTDIV